jgi:hypothetical protein
MSELDLDIRAVSSASLGARSAASDANQVVPAAATDQSTAANTTQSVQPAIGGSGQPSFRYDSFRFVYTPSYGRIVLIDQNPETGKAISQIPSQRALQLYADQKRAELQTELTPSAKGGAQQGQGAVDSGRHEFVGQAAGQGADSGTSSRVSGQSAASSPLTLQSSTPTPPPAFLLANASPVNITI